MVVRRAMTSVALLVLLGGGLTAALTLAPSAAANPSGCEMGTSGVQPDHPHNCCGQQPEAVVPDGEGDYNNNCCGAQDPRSPGVQPDHHNNDNSNGCSLPVPGGVPDPGLVYDGPGFPSSFGQPAPAAPTAPLAVAPAVVVAPQFTG